MAAFGPTSKRILARRGAAVVALWGVAVASACHSDRAPSAQPAEPAATAPPASPELPGLAAADADAAEARRLEAAGDLAAAEGQYKHALALTDANAGARDGRTAARLVDLADFYRTTGRPGEAEPLYQKAVAIVEEVAGPDDPSILPALRGLAALLEARGEHEEAGTIQTHIERIERANPAAPSSRP